MAMAAPAAFPLRRLAARPQKMGSEARRPIAAREKLATAAGTLCTMPAEAKPAAAARNNSGRARWLRCRLAQSRASAPNPKVNVDHQPVANVDAPADTRILGRKKLRP